MIYVKQSNGAQVCSSQYNIQVVNFKLGNVLNTDLSIPLPKPMQFWNTAILSFQVVLEGNMRDAISSGLINTIHSGHYMILDRRIFNSDAWVCVCKFR